MNNQQTEPGCQGHQPVSSILEAARAVLTVTRAAQNWSSANEEDPNIGYGVVREGTFVPFTQL